MSGTNTPRFGLEHPRFWAPIPPRFGLEHPPKIVYSSKHSEHLAAASYPFTGFVGAWGVPSFTVLAALWLQTVCLLRLCSRFIASFAFVLQGCAGGTRNPFSCRCSGAVLSVRSHKSRGAAPLLGSRSPLFILPLVLCSAKALALFLPSVPLSGLFSLSLLLLQIQALA